MTTSAAFVSGLEAELALRDHFDHKRASIRFPCRAPLTICSEDGSIVGRAVDVSRAGVLVDPVDTGLADGDAPASLLAFSCLVSERFGDGVRLRFEPFDTDGCAAGVVRTLRCPESGRFLIAFRFRDGLPPGIARRLGL